MITTHQFISDYAWYRHGLKMVETILYFFRNNVEVSGNLRFVPWDIYRDKVKFHVHL
jgi:hypothetical protein